MGGVNASASKPFLGEISRELAVLSARQASCQSVLEELLGGFAPGLTDAQKHTLRLAAQRADALPPNAYHNARHVAEVLYCACRVLKQNKSRISHAETPLFQFNLMLAALIHDDSHPGEIPAGMPSGKVEFESLRAAYPYVLEDLDFAETAYPVCLAVMGTAYPFFAGKAQTYERLLGHMRANSNHPFQDIAEMQNYPPNPTHPMLSEILGIADLLPSLCSLKSLLKGSSRLLIEEGFWPEEEPAKTCQRSERFLNIVEGSSSVFSEWGISIPFESYRKGLGNKAARIHIIEAARQTPLDQIVSGMRLAA